MRETSSHISTTTSSFLFKFLHTLLLRSFFLSLNFNLPIFPRSPAIPRFVPLFLILIPPPPRLHSLSISSHQISVLLFLFSSSFIFLPFLVFSQFRFLSPLSSSSPILFHAHISTTTRFLSFKLLLSLLLTLLSSPSSFHLNTRLCRGENALFVLVTLCSLNPYSTSCFQFALSHSDVQNIIPRSFLDLFLSKSHKIYPFSFPLFPPNFKSIPFFVVVKIHFLYAPFSLSFITSASRSSRFDFSTIFHFFVIKF